MAENRTGQQKPFRLMFKFWLDITKDDENDVAETIKILKERRTFTKTIRDGIRLINDLRQGKTEVLLELFPWVRAKLALELQAEQAALPTNPIQAQLNRLEHLLLEQGAVPIQPRNPPPLRADPAEEAPDLDIQLTKPTGPDRSSWNFMLSMAQITGNITGLPPEVIEYGIQVGKIKPHAKPSRGNPKPMDVPLELPPPDVPDDLDLLI